MIQSGNLWITNTSDSFTKTKMLYNINKQKFEYYYDITIKSNKNKNAIYWGKVWKQCIIKSITQRSCIE